MGKGKQGTSWILIAAGVVAAALLARPLASRTYSNLAMAVLYAYARSGEAGIPAGEYLARAEALLNRALALDAGNGGAHRGLGFVLWERGDRQEAGAHWRRGEIPVADFIRAGWAAERAEDIPKALDWYARAMAAWPDASDPYVRMAILRGRDKDWEAALALYEQALAADSFLSAWAERQAHEGRANALRNLGRAAEALPDYEWLVVHAPDYYWGYTRLADLVWQVQGDEERAERLYLQAVALDASNKWAYRGLAALYEETGRPAEAEAMYRKVLELDPEDAVARRGLERLVGKR